MNAICANSVCKKDFRKRRTTQTYCSQPCASAQPRKTKKTFCKECGERALSGRKYCIAHKRIWTNRGKMPKEERIGKLSILVRNHMQRLKAKAVDFLGSKCFLCEYNKSIAALEFHHIDPTRKKFQLSGKSITWERYVVELLKCLLLCANCHREVENGVSSIDGIQGACCALVGMQV